MAMKYYQAKDSIPTPPLQNGLLHMQVSMTASNEDGYRDGPTWTIAPGQHVKSSDTYSQAGIKAASFINFGKLFVDKGTTAPATVDVDLDALNAAHP